MSSFYIHSKNCRSQIFMSSFILSLRPPPSPRLPTFIIHEFILINLILLTPLISSQIPPPPQTPFASGFSEGNCWVFLYRSELHEFIKNSPSAALPMLQYFQFPPSWFAWIPSKFPFLYLSWISPSDKRYKDPPLLATFSNSKSFLDFHAHWFVFRSLWELHFTLGTTILTFFEKKWSLQGWR